MCFFSQTRDECCGETDQAKRSNRAAGSPLSVRSKLLPWDSFVHFTANCVHEFHDTGICWFLENNLNSWKPNDMDINWNTSVRAYIMMIEMDASDTWPVIWLNKLREDFGLLRNDHEYQYYSCTFTYLDCHCEIWYHNGMLQSYAGSALKMIHFHLLIRSYL